MLLSPEAFREIMIGAGFVGASLILHLLFKRVVLRWLSTLFGRAQHRWGRLLDEHGVVRILSHLIPALVLYQGASVLPTVEEIGTRLISVWIIIILLLTADKLLGVGLTVYNEYPVALKRPLKGYVQTAKLIMYITGGILVISILIDQSPWFFLSGLGALTAVLMLVFRDTILSFIAGIQLMGNDLVRVGDWLEIPKFNADGAVVEVALHTIKVRNWDNTITTIPTYKLMEDAFKNWRGMTESGGRRIKRSLLIDQSSIQFCSDEMIANLRKIHVLQDYIDNKQQELADYNAQHGIDTSIKVNGRRMTNIGTFRAYIEGYLRHHPKVRQDMIMLIRQMQPSTEGLPLEIYVFTNDTAWVRYEGIQSDIFDHLLAVLPEFGLRIAQQPLGHDLTRIGGQQDLASSLKNVSIPSD